MHSVSRSSSPLVSVIIPNYNGAQFLPAALESVLAQTYSNIEIIVVDDGSTDNSVTLIERFAKTDDRICMVRQENRGVAAARNVALSLATGKYVAPLDSDDVWLPEKISAQVDLMESSGSEVGLVYGWSAAIDESGTFQGGINAGQFEGNVFADLMFGNFIGNGSAPLMRRECLDAVGLYDETFAAENATGCEDRDLYLRIAARYQFRVARKVLIGYRRHNGNMSRNAALMRRSHRVLMERVRARHRLPKRFLNRSSAFNSLYLERISASQHSYVASALYMARAARLYPGFLRSTDFYRLVRLRAVKFIRHWLPFTARHRRRPLKGREAVSNLERAAELIAEQLESAPVGWIEESKRRSANLLRQWLAESVGADQRNAYL